MKFTWIHSWYLSFHPKDRQFSKLSYNGGLGGFCSEYRWTRYDIPINSLLIEHGLHEMDGIARFLNTLATLLNVRRKTWSGGWAEPKWPSQTHSFTIHQSSPSHVPVCSQCYLFSGCFSFASLTVNLFLISITQKENRYPYSRFFPIFGRIQN